MATLKIPRKYQRAGADRMRYIEGWQDAQAGRAHAYSVGQVADEFTRHNGQAQLQAYSEGYIAGSPPIGPPPRPSTVTGERLQVIQAELGRLQQDYRDTDVAFLAIALAWESVRCAWYVVSQNSFEKVQAVQQALDYLERR
jgi:hypothetical protein